MRDLTADHPHKGVRASRVAAKIAEHRSAIDQAARAIMTIERERDMSVRDLASQLEQAEFIYNNAVSHFTREISKAKTYAESRIGIQRQLLHSSEAALHPLEPFEAPKDEDASKRRVPRAVAGI